MKKCNLFQGCKQNFFNIWKLIKSILCGNMLKKKDHMDLSVTAENASDRMKHPFMKKISENRKWELLKLIKSIFQKRNLQSTLLTDYETLNLFPLRLGIKQGRPLPQTLVNIRRDCVAASMGCEIPIKCNYIKNCPFWQRMRMSVWEIIWHL